MAKLVVLSEGLKGLSCDVKAEKTTVGRLEDNNFQVAEQSVSSHHCEVVLRGADVMVKDLGSTNGTFINGEKITEAALKPGQILRLGQVELRLESGTAGSPPAASPPPSPAKKPLDKTMALPQGVKAAEMSKTIELGANTGFSKRSNKANKIFIVVGIVFGLLVIAMIILALMNLK
jgi:pSer/pThr/pTyr-binding forkhead associated (FHA) protein